MQFTDNDGYFAYGKPNYKIARGLDTPAPPDMKLLPPRLTGNQKINSSSPPRNPVGCLWVYEQFWHCRGKSS